MTEIIIDTDLVSSIPVSPFLYGMNSAFTYQRDRNATRLEWEKAREAGVRLMRLCAGNNGTKYNWQKKISSHPDWYNNVYPDDWDTAARALEKELPGVSGMWCFQLLGKAASSSGYNFNDKGFNDERWWEGVEQNLAGYGVPDMRGGNRALREGDPSLYLMDWPVDSSVALLNHWFATPGLGLDKQIHQYWNLDNEPDIWNVTHDDVMREQLPVLTRLGVGLSEFGERTFLLDALPPFVKAPDARRFVIELVDELRSAGQEVNSLTRGYLSA